MRQPSRLDLFRHPMAICRLTVDNGDKPYYEYFFVLNTALIPYFVKSTILVLHLFPAFFSSIFNKNSRITHA